MNDPRLKYHTLGFLEVVDVPSSEELKIFYADHYYQSERGNYRKSYPPIERDYLNLKIAQKAAIVDGIRQGNTPGKMLDVGCGEGFALEWFQKKGWSVEGIDHSIDGIARMHPELQHLVQAGDLFGLLNDRITGGKLYDLVWLNNVLEHVAEPVALLSALRKLISPDGVIVVTVPNDGSKYQEFLLANGNISRRFWISLPDHLAYFNYNSLRSIVEATGWLCHDIISDFPIDFFLLHEGSNYINDPSKGPEAHRARIGFELMLGQLPHSAVNNFYRSMAKVGLGRSLIAFLKPASEITHAERNRLTLTETVPEKYICMPRPKLEDGSSTVEALQPEHIEAVRQWRNAQMDVLRQAAVITPAQQEAYYAEHIWPDMLKSNPSNILLAFKERGQLIGYGGLVHIVWEHRRAEVSFLLNPALAERQDDYARSFAAFLNLMKELAFDELSLNRLYTETYSMREHHISILESAGFCREGVLRCHVKIKGHFVDSIIHGCVRTARR